MARMFPREESKLSEKMPYSERAVYSKLKQLTNEYVIFHSVQWVNKHYDTAFTWYENDFLIFHKKFGILVLEIKGGEISFKEGLFIQKNTDSNEEVILDEGNDPISQAKRGVYHYRKILEKRIPGIKSRILIEPCIWFPSTEIHDDIAFPLVYDESRDAILDSKSLENVSKSIESVYNYYNANIKNNITDNEFEDICKIIAPEFDLIPSPSIIRDELESAFLRLTNQQKGLLDYISEQRVATIQGVAGTGKTLVALEAAKRFSLLDKKVLFLCFNRFLYEHLKYDCPIDGVDFYNINTFVAKFTDIDIITDEDRVRELKRVDSVIVNYQAIIIDEAQDFQDEEIEYFATAAELYNMNFLVFYDKNQLVTTKKVSDWIINSECKLVLTKNCRNTIEIATTSYNVIDIKNVIKNGAIKGDQPTISFINSNNVISIGHIIRYYMNENNGYLERDITILTMGTEEKSIINKCSTIDGIVISKKRNNKNVFFTTARKFKGLESNVVIIIDIDEACFNDEAKKRAFYVACSRAKHRLSLIIDSNKESIKRIANSINDMPGLSDIGKIVMKTQTKLHNF